MNAKQLSEPIGKQVKALELTVRNIDQLREASAAGIRRTDEWFEGWLRVVKESLE